MNTSVSTILPIALSTLTTQIAQNITDNLTTPLPNIIQNDTKPSMIPDVILPKKGSSEEHSYSLAIFFVLSVIAVCILVIHLILHLKISCPESLAVVICGTLIGLCIKLSSRKEFNDWQKEEMINPTTFFLLILPPIIFDQSYNLHKGNFFQNIGSIFIFAIFGTLISAVTIGAGIWLLGIAEVAFPLSFTESFAFGSLISAVDPVATLAIFKALNIDPVLSMLVFGESILNDAVSIVLANTALETDHIVGSVLTKVTDGIIRFIVVFFGSAIIGVINALIAALLFKHISLRKNPSLEFGMMLVFIYAPYGLAEGVKLSGIQALVFNGIVMSHYVHFNLSPITQVVMQSTIRTLAFIAETCVFAYLGLALFSFPLKIEPSFVIWSIVLCLVGRAANIYPLSYLCNYFREHKISKRMMFVMWFSSMRGAVSYSLSLNSFGFDASKRHVIVTTTLIIVLFTIILLGGSTLPMMRYLNADQHSRKGRKRKNKKITLSKTKELGATIEADHLSEFTEEELGRNFLQNNLGFFVKFDVQYLTPFFTRRFTEQEVRDCKSQMTDLTNKWYQTVKRPDSIEEEDEEQHDDQYA